MSQTITWPCRYPGCKSRICGDGEKITGQKFCKPHTVIRKMERQMAGNESKKKKRLQKKSELKCIECDNPLGLWKSKFCSNGCMEKNMSARRKRARLDGRIEYHKKMIEKLERLKGENN